MGLAASSGRLLLLTARRSDLEFRAQNITQRRMTLMSASDEASKEYEASINNRRLFFHMAGSGNAEDPRLNYGHIVNEGKDGGLNYRLVDANGNIIVNKMPDNPGSTSSYKVIENINDPDILEQGLRSGAWFIEKPIMVESSETRVDHWEKVVFNQITSISDELNETDDAAALAKYNRIKEQIALQDKRLDIELKGIEAEHKAVSTEVESVQKIALTNAEKTFGKTFNA